MISFKYGVNKCKYLYFNNFWEYDYIELFLKMFKNVLIKL